MEYAILEAEKSERDFRMGAVLMYKKRVISTGYNRYLSDRIDYDTPSLHAEADCISKFTRSFRRKQGWCLKEAKLKLFVARITKNNEICCSKCCNMCSEMIEDCKKFNVHITVFFISEEKKICKYDGIPYRNFTPGFNVLI